MQLMDLNEFRVAPEYSHLIFVGESADMAGGLVDVPISTPSRFDQANILTTDHQNNILTPAKTAKIQTHRNYANASAFLRSFVCCERRCRTAVTDHGPQVHL